AVVSDVRADVDDIVVELHDMIEGRTDRGQRRLYVLERDLHLLARIGAHLAGLVDAELTGEIDRAARSGHFHHVAVARRLLHGVWIRKTKVVRHAWAPVGGLREGRRDRARNGCVTAP